MTIRESFSLGAITRTVNVGYTPVGSPQHIIIDQDTVITATMSLRPGDTVEFRNGSQLLFGPGGKPDWQGTPVDTWANNGATQNLDRDIKFFGEGNVRFLAGSLVGTIRYVELSVQPKLEPGFFPLHWHMMGDDSRGQVVTGVVVKDSPNRAFVPHASHGITFFDCIASNIAGSAWWWNPPAFQSEDRSDNTNHLLISGCLADGITNEVGDDRGFTLSAFPLLPGVGNAIQNSVARRVNPSHPKNASGFLWPELHHNQPLSWGFTDNACFDTARSHGIHTWQNNNQTHVIDRFTSDGAISHGAYVNKYDYRNCDVAGVIIHATGWTLRDSHVGDVVAKKHQTDSPITWTNVMMDSLTVSDAASGSQQAPMRLIINGTNLNGNNIVWLNPHPQTTVTINGVVFTP